MPSVYLKWDGVCLDRILSEQKATLHWCNVRDLVDPGARKKKLKKPAQFEVRAQEGRALPHVKPEVTIVSTTPLFDPADELVVIEARITAVDRVGCLVMQVRDKTGALVYAERLSYKEVRMLPAARPTVRGPRIDDPDLTWASGAGAPYTFTLLVADTRTADSLRVHASPALDADPAKLLAGVRADLPPGWAVRSRESRAAPRNVTSVKVARIEVPAEIDLLAAIADKSATVAIRNIGTGPLVIGELGVPPLFAIDAASQVTPGAVVLPKSSLELKLRYARADTRVALTDAELASLYGQTGLTIASNDPDFPVKTVAAKLDEGAKFLATLARPKQVNDATADKLSNCALTTLAGLQAGATSGAIATAMRATKGLDKTTEQSQKVWAISMLDSVVLDAKGLKGRNDPDSTKAKKSLYDQNKLTIKGLEEFGEGNAFVVGDAQYYGMLKFLLELSRAPDLSFAVHEHGEPGNHMEVELDLVALMKRYPSGTRFAVFVYSSTPGQHVGAHWIYAEALGGQVIFRDFQVNTTARKGPDSYLNQLPFSPDVAKDKGQSFETGCFIACVPRRGAPVTVDPEVDEDKVDNILAGVAHRMATLLAPLQSAGQKLPTRWPVLGAKALDCIPSPSLTGEAIAAVAAVLGCPGKTSQFNLVGPGTIKIMSGPVHAANVKVKEKIKVGIEYEMVDVERDELHFSPAVGLPVVKRGAAPARDDLELPVTPSVPSKESDYETAFSRTYNVQAQNTASGIELNATNVEFTDMIHEATHSFEGQTGEAPFKEGLCDLLAGMATHTLLAEGAGDRFAYAYNPSYAPYVAAMNVLIPLVGLPTLAHLYFVAPDHKAYLRKQLEALVTVPVGEIMADLFSGSEGFPETFYRGVEKLRAARVGQVAIAALADEPERVRARHQNAFTKFLNDESKKYDDQYGKGLSSLDERGKAEGVDRWYGVGVMERRLRILFMHKPEVTGSQLTKLQKIVDLHEAGIRAATGETTEALRKRVLPPVKLTFKLAYTPKADEKVCVCGDVPELGDWSTDRAIELPLVTAGNYSAEIAPAGTGTALTYRYLVKSGAKVTWESGKARGTIVPITDVKVLDDRWT